MSADSMSFLLQNQIEKQKKHCWYANPAQIKQVITPSVKTWLYWRKLFLWLPPESESTIERNWTDGFQPILSFGLTEKGVLASLIASHRTPSPFWVIPADFIQEEYGVRLMEAASSSDADDDADEYALNSAVVTAEHPHSDSQYALGKAFKETLEQRDVQWLYEGFDGSFVFY